MLRNIYDIYGNTDSGWKDWRVDQRFMFYGWFDTYLNC